MLATSLSLSAAEFYVAPSGQSSNTGGITSPWDLQTALNHPSSVKPGDTIWLRGGTHRIANRITKFTSRLAGASGAPITVRQYPGERATIDGNIQHDTGGWVNYWGFEIINSHPSRYTDEVGSWPQKWWVTYDGKLVDLCVAGIDLRAPNIKLINLVVHDAIGNGIFISKTAQNTELHGCLSYYNGWQAPDRAHGHGFYGQNAAPYTLTAKESMFFENLAIGFQATGAGPDAVADNCKLEGNAFFMNGILAYQHQQNFLLGAFQGVAQNPSIIRNFVYDTKGSSSDSYIGYTGGSANAVVRDNVFGTSAMFSSANVNMTATGNIFAAGAIGLNQISYPNNTYAKPTANVISVRPNAYEMGRGNIVVYNYQKLNSVAVDVSSTGLKVGDQYELRNVADFYNDVMVGTYGGGAISIPMTGHTVAKPTGQNFSAPPSTFPDFGTFVIMKKGGSTTPSPTNTAPVISSIANKTINEDTASGALSFTVSDKETAAGSLTVTASSSNTMLVPNGNIIVSGSSSNRSVTITPASNQSGSTTVTLQASDGSMTATRSFVLTVAAVNDSPTLSVIANQTTQQNKATAPVGFTVSDVETPAANLVVTGSSSNPTLVPNANIAFGGSGANRTVTITPSANQTGTATITVKVSDGTVSTTKTFVLTVQAVANTAPTISSIPAQTTQSNKATAPISFTIADAETAAGNLTVVAASSNTALVPNANIVLGGTGGNRTITIIPASNQTGTTTITVSVNDGLASKSTAFTLTVTGGTTPPPSSTNKVVLGLEAESGKLVAPMMVATNVQLPAQRYVWSLTANQGSVSLAVNVTQADTYYIWCKILAPTYANDSFFVSVDGKEDIFDAAEGKQSANWQWARVNGRNGGAPLSLNPRTFSLSQGTHTIVIRAREVKAAVDRILITNDPNYVPKDIVAVGDSQTVYAGTATQIPATVLVANDVNPFNSKLSINTVGAATNGTATLSNGSVVYTPKTGFIGTDGFTYTITDGQGSTSTAAVTVQVQAAGKVYLGFEAEDGTIVAPMVVKTNSQLPAQRYISSATVNQGTVTFTIDIPKTDTYVMWGKVLGTSYNSDSFSISVDGKEDVFDAAEGKQSANWQWSQVNGRNGGAPLTLNPRTFSLTQGQHTIVVRGREANTGFDRIVISNDGGYAPEEVSGTGDIVTAKPNMTTSIPTATLLSNDVSLFGDALKITVFSVPQNGSAVMAGNAISYTPKAGFVGTDTFTYTVADEQGSTSAAVVTVKVQ